MQELKANTQVKVVIGPFVDATDGLTPETGITLGTADEAELMKHDAASVTDISGATWAAITSMDGYYNLTLTTSHTDTEGMLTVAINDDSVCLPVVARFKVLAEAAYDSLYAAKDTGFMDVNVKAVSEDTTAADNLESACDSYSATRGLAGTALPAVAAGGAGGLPTDSTGKTSFNDLSAAAVNSEVDTALSDIGLDHLLSAAVTGTDVTDNSIIAKLVSKSATADWDDFVNTTDSLQALRDQGDSAWITATGFSTHSAADVWTSGSRTLTAATNITSDGSAVTMSSSGVVGTVNVVNTTTTNTDMLTTAAVNAEVDTALSDIGLDHLVSAAVTGTDVADNSIVAYLVDDAATADWDNYDNTANSLQAIRVRGDAAWTTGGGGSITDILDVYPLIPTSVDLANTATVRLGLQLRNALDDLPTTGEITPGTISIDRKAIGGTSWSSIVSDAACSEAAGLIYYDEVFDSGTGYAEGDSLRITFKSQKITVSANDYEITGTGGVIFQTEIRQTMRGTDSAYTGTPPTAASIRAEIDSNSTQLAAIVTDTNELQGDWTDGGRLDLIVDAILVDTAEIGAAGAGLTNLGGMSTAMKAEVNAEADTALTDYDAPTKAEMDAAFTEIKGATWASGTDTLEAIRDRGDSAWVTGNTTTPPTAAAIRTEIDSNSTQLAAIVADTNELQGDWADGGRLDLILDARASQASVDTVDGNVDAILVDTGTTIPATLSGLNDISVSDVLTTAMTESYGTDGSTLTLAQCCYLILGNVGEFAISGTTKTVKKLDGSTTGATYTLDDADNPTSITRAT